MLLFLTVILALVMCALACWIWGALPLPSGTGAPPIRQWLILVTVAFALCYIALAAIGRAPLLVRHL